MKPFGWKSLAASSLLLTSLAVAGTRPHYGGTIRIMTHIAPTSLDPLDQTQADALAQQNLTQLLFDTLVVLDDVGRTNPGLAISWQADSGDQRWRFWIRQGVKFDDGTLLTPTLVAASLRSANPGWSVYVAEDSISVGLQSPDPAFPATLAQPRNAIVRRTADKVSGTGPFRISDWRPGKLLVAAANEEYWGGRPLVDSVQVDFGIRSGDQLVALDLNRADVIEIAPEQSKRAAQDGHRVAASAPFELMAIVFTRDRQSLEDGKLRRALALSIDRSSIRNVLLQGTGDPAGAILPNWMTGYEFLFPAEADMEKAREQRIEVAQAPVWTIGFNAADPLTRLVAERVVLNARDAGLPMQTSALNVDLRVVRVQAPSLDPQVALAGIAAKLGLPAPVFPDPSSASLYAAENTILQDQRIIPLFHLPVNYGLNSRVKNLELRRDGTWVLANTWLGAEKP
jgi:peptide/nickel transport system substrate-binding protein